MSFSFGDFYPRVEDRVILHVHTIHVHSVPSKDPEYFSIGAAAFLLNFSSFRVNLRHFINPQEIWRLDFDDEKCSHPCCSPGNTYILEETLEDANKPGCCARLIGIL